jgi:peptidoglycan hydrolase FlgJ
MDLGTAERLMSAPDPETLSALKDRQNDPVAAKAVAGQFAALFIKNVMQEADGDAIAIAGDGTGSNVVSDMFATAIAQTTASDGKLGLADMLFRAIEAKQQAAAGGDTPAPPRAPPAGARHGRSTGSHPAPQGLSLRPYRQDNGLRPLPPGVTPQQGLRPPLPRPNTPTLAMSLAGRIAALPIAPLPAAIDRTGTAARPAGPSAEAASPQQRRAFAQRLRPMLAAAARQLGVDPSILLAHAALETGWGRSVVGNNLFAIKAGDAWPGAAVTTATHEVEDGERVAREASFRAYPSLDASVADYVALIGGDPRYQGLLGLGDDVEAYARGLVAGGYATDTDYESKLEAIAADAATAFASATAVKPWRWGLFASPGATQ